MYIGCEYSRFKFLFSIFASLKEYQDVTNVNIASYMQQNQVSVLSRNQVDIAYKQKELECIEARNKMDICQKQVFLINNAWLLLSSNMCDQEYFAVIGQLFGSIFCRLCDALVR